MNERLKEQSKMSKKDQPQRVLERQEQIYLYEFFDGKTPEEVAEKIWATAAHHHQRSIDQDNLLKFKVHDYDDEGESLFLEIWRWETDAEMTKRLKKERVAAEKRKKKSEAVKATTMQKEYAEYRRLRAKFGDDLE